MESLFSKHEFGAGGQLSAVNYGSGVPCIQARTRVDRMTTAVKGYRDDLVTAQTTPVLFRSEVTIHVEGRSKPYGLSVTEFLFPFKSCQSSLWEGEKWEQCMYPHDNSCWKLFSKERAPKYQFNCVACGVEFGSFELYK